MDFSADAAELTMQQLLLPRSWYILHMLWEETQRCVLRGFSAHDASPALTHNRLSSDPTAQGANCGITEQQMRVWKRDTSSWERARHRWPDLPTGARRFLLLVARKTLQNVPVERRSVRMVLTKPTLNLGFQPVTLIKQPHRNCCDSKMRHLIFIHQIKSIIKVLLEPIEPHCIRTTILLSPKGPLKILIDPSKQGHGRKSVDQTKNPTNFTRT